VKARQVDPAAARRLLDTLTVALTVAQSRIDRLPFGPKLRALRVARGMSQSALARAAHCSEAMVGRAETGIRRPTAGMAAAWDRALGTTPLLASLLDDGRPAR
jgi:DNA-binding transcriptional regulator YiaG